MSRGRVLVVDDDADIREVIAATLELNGFTVQTLRDGIDALTLEEHYDAIMLDLKMPIFDGERLADYWQLTNPSLLERLILMTGYSHRPSQSHVPAFAVIHKPLRYEEILRVVSECVARNREAQKACRSDVP